MAALSPSDADRPQAGARLTADLPWLGLLWLATLIAYAPMAENGFVNFDDNFYITENPHVTGGLTWANIRWAFTTTYYGIYHPLAWLSHQLDAELFGLRAAGHHAHSLLIHLVNTALLFLFLRRATGQPAPSALAAAIFALHPLQVQSVAWATERKNVLCALFWLLALLAWQRHVGRPSRARYLLALGLFVTGLLAKSFIVTQPLALLLLELWPLRRLELTSPWAAVWPRVRAVLPFLPFALLASAFGLYAARHSINADVLLTFEDWPLGPRLGNVLVGYQGYLAKFAWPADLTFYYSFPLYGWPLWRLASAWLVLASLTVLAFAAARRHPAVLVGWCWFLVVLTPNNGLAQYGMQLLADRYIYLPIIGLAVAVAWLAARHRALLAALFVLVLAGGIARTRDQVRTWRDDRAFFSHGLTASTDPWTVAYSHLYLGREAFREQRIGDARRHFLETVMSTRMAESHNNLAACDLADGRIDDAINGCVRALMLNPRLIRAHYNLGLALVHRGDLERAAPSFQRAADLSAEARRRHQGEPLKREAVEDDALSNLGAIRFRQGRTEEAIAHYRAALAVNPRHASAHYNLANALELIGQPAAAQPHYAEALRLNPSNAGARAALQRLAGHQPEVR